MARNFQYKTEVFFKEILLHGPLWETKHYAIRFEFQEVVHMSIRLYGFSMHEIFKIKLPTSSLLSKQ